VLAETYTFLDVIWSMILFGLFVMWIWVVIMTFADIFRRYDISGWSKALWSIFIIFLPFLGVFIYLITRPKMTEQDQRMMEQYETQQRRMAGYSSAEEIAKLTELRNSGAITAEEFEELKRKAM
jgi:type VI protein secretion system component VasK